MRCKNFITTWSIYYFNSWKYSLLFHQLISFSWFHEIKGKVTLWSILLHGSKAKAFNWSNRNTSTSVKGINSQSISTNIITLLGKLLNSSKAKAFNWSNRKTSTSVKGINSQSISTNIITLLGKLLNLNYWWLDVQNLGETHVNRVVRISIWASDLHNISREKHKLYQERKIAG